VGKSEQGREKAVVKRFLVLVIRTFVQNDDTKSTV